MDPFHMGKMQTFRDKYFAIFGQGVGIIADGGGFRGYGSLTSAHAQGMACDLAIPKEHYHTALKIALELNFLGIGMKQHGGRSKFHLDSAPEIPDVRPRPWVWTYP